MNQRWQKQAAIFIAGQTVSLFGSMLVQFAISWHITLTTKSGMMLTISTVCGFLPQVLISLFAGVWADRFDRKKMIVLADAGIAAATAVLAVLFSMGYGQLWLLFVISIIRSLGQGVQMPAVNALLPDIVPQERLMRVNGLNSGIQSMMMLFAPAAAGAFYERVQAGRMQMRDIFLIDVLTAAIGISLLLALRIARKAPPAASQPHVLRDMAVGMRYVIDTKWLREFFLVYVLYTLMFAPVMFLTPLMVARSFGEEPWRLVAHEIVFAAGMTAGGVAAGVWAGKCKNKVVLVLMACAAFGAATGVMGFSPNFWFYLATMLAAGLAMPFCSTGSMTILQTRVEPKLMGRVFSLVLIVNSGILPLSMAAFGPVADLVRVETLLVLSGGVMVAVSLLSLRLRDMVAAGRPPQDAEGVALPAAS